MFTIECASKVSHTYNIHVNLYINHCFGSLLAIEFGINISSRTPHFPLFKPSYSVSDKTSTSFLPEPRLILLSDSTAK